MKTRALRCSLSIVAMALVALVVVGCPSPTGGGDNGGGPGGDSGSPAGAIGLNPSMDQGIRVAETLTVTASADAGQTVTWSADSTAVTLVPSGTSVEITGAALGSATVTAALPSGESASLSVIVYEPGIVLTGATAATVVDSETVDLSGFAELTPPQFVTQTFIYSSDLSTVASVSASGIVTGESPGTATITITSGVDPSDSVDVTLRVDPFPVDIALTLQDGTPISTVSLLTGGANEDLDASVTPASFPDEVTWTIDDPAVATVDGSGVVTPVAAGSTEVVATSDYNTARQVAIPVEVGTPGRLTVVAVDGIGGPYLSGADVTLTGPSNLNGTTDASGEVTFPSVMPGVYTIDVTSSGYATSRVQGFSMTLEDQTIELPAYETAAAFRSLNPPQIAVSGIAAGGTYPAPVSVTATATGDNPIVANSNRFALAVGVNAPADGRNAMSTSGTGELSFTFDSNDLPDNEPVKFTFVAYDNNNNRTQYSFDVNTSNGSGSAPFQSVFASRVNFVQAVTWGVQQPFFGTGGAQPFAAGADSTLEVRISVDRPATSITGLRVYRSNSATGPFVPIGNTTTVSQVDADGDPGTPGTESAFAFTDTSSILTPGEDYFYRFAYFNGFGEGSTTGSTHGVTILPAYRLNLVDPADQAGDVANPVTLSWQVTVDGTMPAAADREDLVYLVDPTTAQLLAGDVLINGSNYAVGTLASSSAYEWNVSSRWTSDGTTAQASSVAYPSNLGFVPYLSGVGSLANNGGFQFTVE